MKDQTIENRTCLRCGSEFPSTGTGNRICGRCKQARGYRGAVEKLTWKERW